jgi:hypothetical protein
MGIDKFPYAQINMATKKQTAMLELPAQAGKDVKALTGIVERWSSEAEGLVKEVFDWGKRHKLLLALGIGLVLAKRYLLDEQESKEEDEDY